MAKKGDKNKPPADQPTKHEGLYDRAKHAISEAIYGKAPTKKSTESASQGHPENKGHGQKRPESASQGHPENKAHGQKRSESASQGHPESKQRDSLGREQHKGKSAESKDSSGTSKSGVSKGLSLKDVASLLPAPIQKSLTSVGREIYRKEQVIQRVLTSHSDGQERAKRQPKEMTPDEAKRQERIALMKPEERARLKISQSEDPKTHVLYSYDKRGLLTDSRALNGEHKQIQYKENSREPAVFKITPASAADKPVVHTLDANNRIAVDQRSGDVRVDEKQKTADGKTQNVEHHYSSDGSQSKITSQDGVRLHKEIYAPINDVVKKTADLTYEYFDRHNKSVSPEHVTGEFKCAVVQTNADGTQKHAYRFNDQNDLKNWKPASQTDTLVEIKGSVTVQTTDAFEFKNGKAEKSYHNEETLDYATGSSSSETHFLQNGKVVAKDFARKEVSGSGDTKIITTAIQQQKEIQHREASFDSEGHSLSLVTTKEGHTVEVKFNKEGKVSTKNGRPEVVRDGKPILFEKLSPEEQKLAQAEVKRLSAEAVTYMRDTHQRFDVRAKVILKDENVQATEEENRKASRERVLNGTKEFVRDGVKNKCDDRGRIVEQTRDQVTVVITYEAEDVNPKHFSIHPPGTPNGGEYAADPNRTLTMNQSTGEFSVIQTNARHFKIWQETFAPGDNLAARTHYSYRDKEGRLSTDPEKIDPHQSVVALATNREGKVTDHYLYADFAHVQTHDINQHLKFDARTGKALKLLTRVQAARGGDSLVEYMLEDGNVTAIKQDGREVNNASADAKEQIALFVRGLQQQYYPAESKTATNSKMLSSRPDGTTSENNVPIKRELNETDKERLKQLAKEVHHQAGYDNYVFTHADGAAIVKLLETLKTQEEIDAFKRLYREENQAEVEEQLSKCGYFQSYNSFHLQALLTADETEKTACEMRRAIAEHQSMDPTGRSKWVIETDMRKRLSHLDHDQMMKVEQKFVELYPDQSSMSAAILSMKGMPQELKDSLAYYHKGVDNLTSHDRMRMADIAVQGKNLDMFREVTANFDDKTRDAYGNSSARQMMLKDAFSGHKLTLAKASLLGGADLVAQEIRDNSGNFFTNRAGVEAALLKLCDEQRRRYAEGRALESKTSLTEDEARSVNTYRTLHGAITATGVREAELRGLEDNVVMKGGGLVSQIAKGDGYIYVSGAHEQLDKIANMNEADWQKLHDYVKGVNGPAHPEYRQELERALTEMKGYRIGDEEVRKLLKLYDKKIGADSFTESRITGQKDLLDALASQRGFTNDRAAALQAIAQMSPEEQRRYRTSARYRELVDEELSHFKQFTNSDAYDQAQRLLHMYKDDAYGVLSRFREISNLPEAERNALAKNSAHLKELENAIGQMADGASKESAQRMFNQFRAGRQPEMLDIFAKLAGTRSEWSSNTRETVRSIEDAFKDDPTLLKRLQNPVSESDKELAAHFNRLSSAAFGDGNAHYGNEILKSADGRLSLSSKLMMNSYWTYTDRQGIIEDIAQASELDRELLKDRNSDLRKQVDDQLKLWYRIYNGAAERDLGQKQVLEHVMQRGKVTEADQLRSYMNDVGYSSKIIEIMKTSTPEKLDRLCAEYEQTYHRNLRVDLVNKLGKKEATEALNLLYRPKTSEELYRHLVGQYLETRSGFGSAFADTTGSATGYQLDNSINHITTIMSEAHRSGKPLTMEQERVLRSHVDAAVETFTKDKTNFLESKSACAEYTGQAVMAGLTVLGAVMTGGTSLAVEGSVMAGVGTAAVGAGELVQGAQALSNGARALNLLRTSVAFANSPAGNCLLNTGLQMSMLGNDYDTGNIPKDMAMGYVQGKSFEVFSGPRMAGLMRMGEATAANASGKVCASALTDEAFGLTKHITTSEGKRVFQATMQRELGNSLREAWLVGGKELAPGAFRIAAARALEEAVETEIKHNAGRISKRELEKRVAKELEKLAEEKVGKPAVAAMKDQIAEQVRKSCSRVTPAAIVEQRIDRAIKQNLAQISAATCESLVAKSFAEASEQQSKRLFKGLVEYAAENSYLYRFSRGMTMSTLGAGTAGTVNGVMTGVVEWDRSKSFEENMTAMREHISGNIWSSIIGAAQMHPIGMVANHYQTRRTSKLSHDENFRAPNSDSETNLFDARCKGSMDMLAERIILNGGDQSELASAYAHVNELLVESGRSDLSARERINLQRVAEESLWLAANPNLVSGGKNPTSGLAAAEARAYHRHPAQVIGALRELAVTGEFRCPDGTVLRPFTAGGERILKPDIEAASHEQSASGRVDGRRLYASQIFQTLLAHAAYSDRASYNGELIGKGNIGYIDNHIVDLRTNPPRKLNQQAGPDLTPGELTEAYRKLFGRQEDFVLVNKSSRDALSVNVKNTFSSPEDLGRLLFGSQKRGELPLTLQVNTFHEPFFRASNQHTNRISGADQLVTITKVEVVVKAGDVRTVEEISPTKLFDRMTGKLNVNPEDVIVTVATQTSKSANQLTSQIPLKELYRATSDPLDAIDLKAVEVEVSRHPDNLEKRLDLVRYRYEIENRRERITDKWELEQFDKTHERVGKLALVEELEKITEQQFNRSAETNINKQTRAEREAELQLLDKASGILGAAREELSERKTLTLRNRILELEHNLEKLRLRCLEDAKVPGTLSEFGFEYTLSKAIRNARSDSDVVCAFIDLNNFKNVNVFHSMDMGDRALIEWGEQAKEVLKKYNVDPAEALGHFGGDEFGILLTDCDNVKEILTEIQEIRVGCKPTSDDPANQSVCQFINLQKGEQFDYQSFKTTIEPDGSKTTSREPSPVISASLGAVRWQGSMTAEDVLQTADAVMFEKKPLVKKQLNEGGDAVIEPFSDSVQPIVGNKDSEHLQKFVRLASGPKEFALPVERMTHQELIEYCKLEFADRQKLFFDLLNKHRHTQILDRVKSKNVLGKYIASLEHAIAEGMPAEPFTMVRLSIDNFKPVNDMMRSHAKGNRVLREVGSFLRTLEDVEFVGSLGGTSPFLIVKDASKIPRILAECDEYFLRVTKNKNEPEALETYRSAKEGEIPVGLSAGSVQWHPGMDVETLLDLANEQTEAVQKKHIEDNRHTRRDETAKDTQTGDTKMRRASDQLSLMQNLERSTHIKGNKPDVDTGDWRYLNFDRTRRVVTPEYAESKMHILKAITAVDATAGNAMDRRVAHVMFDEKIMNRYVDCLEPVLRLQKSETNGDREQVIAERRALIENSINNFRAELNQPPIKLDTGASIESELNKHGGRAAYRDGQGIIMIRERDLLDAANPEFIAILYHELVHAEQDVAMIRATALDLQRRSSAVKNAQNAEQYSNNAEQQPNNTDHAELDVTGVRAEYAKLRFHPKAAVDKLALVSSDPYGDWFNQVLSEKSSQEWLRERKDLSSEILQTDSEYIRADWLRKSYLTGDAGGKRRVPFSEPEHVLEARIKHLYKLTDGRGFRPFTGDEVEFLRGIKESRAEAIKAYGYDVMSKQFDRRDSTFMNLLKSDRRFANMVEEGQRAQWIPAYEAHVKKLSEQALDCDTRIAALDANAPDFQEQLNKLVASRPDIQDGPRTLKLLTRWELKGLLHGMEQRNWAPIYSFMDGNWNAVLAGHLTLVGQDATNHMDRIKYSTNMRKGQEQEAYYVTEAMAKLVSKRQAESSSSAEQESVKREQIEAGNHPEIGGMIHSKYHPLAEDLSNVNSDELQYRAGRDASPHNLEHISEYIAIARDRMMTLDAQAEPVASARTHSKNLEWEARIAISARYPELVPFEARPAYDNFQCRRLMERELKNDPDLLKQYKEAMAAKDAFIELYKEHATPVFKHNQEKLNEALLEIAKETNTPPLQVHKSDLSGDAAAHMLGTDRMFLGAALLNGRITPEELIAVVTHEVAHNMQNSMIVRFMASELETGTNPTPEKVRELQELYLEEIGRPLEEAYLLAAIKNEQNFSESERSRALELIKSFREVVEGEKLETRMRKCDAALDAFAFRGIDGVMVRAMEEVTNIDNMTENAYLKDLLPDLDHSYLISALKMYAENGSSWKSFKPALEADWKAKVVNLSKQLEKELAAHELRYPSWKHEKEAAAMTELMRRYLQRTMKDVWKGRVFVGDLGQPIKDIEEIKE